MESISLYHGRYTIVEKPRIMINGYNKDFGYGFYCTNIEKQAARWALTKKGGHIVNVYSFVPDDSLKQKRFETMTEEWLEFVVDCRRGCVHDYDLVEGPMADDTIWNYIEDYLNGEISKAAFWELVKFRYPTHQILFATDRALEALTFKSSYAVRKEHDK